MRKYQSKKHKSQILARLWREAQGYKFQKSKKCVTVRLVFVFWSDSDYSGVEQFRQGRTGWQFTRRRRARLAYNQEGMYTVYALRFENGQCYVGMTRDLRRRVHEHRKGKTFFTKGKKIVQVLKLEECSDSVQAREREKFWKSGQGRERLKYSGVEQSGSSLGS